LLCKLKRLKKSKKQSVYQKIEQTIMELSPPESLSRFQGTLSNDLVFKCLNFLTVKEIHTFCQSSRQYYHELIPQCPRESGFWQFYCEHCTQHTTMFNELMRLQYSASAGCAPAASCSSSASLPSPRAGNLSYHDAARVVEGITAQCTVSVHKRPEYERDLQMEGHAGCILLDRYFCIVSGWGPEGSNDVHMFDCGDLMQTGSPGISTPLTIRRIETTTLTSQRFKYGFTVVPLVNCLDSPQVAQMLMFGGCCNGGYSGDCNGE
jgi:hypothetical protein